MINVKVNGMKNLLKNFKNVKDVVAKAEAAALATVSVDIANEAKSNHPFENRTGNLEESIQPKAVEVVDGVIIGKVVAGMSYAAHVEFGTEKTAAYPYLRPALENNKENLKKVVASSIEAANKEACK
jgi:HK97 gp10 family phage protein